MSIKELRNRDAVRLAARINEEPTPEQINEARHVLRLFYIFASAYNKEFLTCQESRTSEAEKAAAKERSAKTYKRASEALKKYNLVICCPGLYPIIDEKNGANFTFGHYYN